MGACGSNKENRKSIPIKLKSTKKKRKSKSRRKSIFEEMNFEIIDKITNKVKQILIKNNATLSELLSLADYNIFGDLDIQLNDNTNITNELNTNLKDIIEIYYPNQTLLTITFLVTTKGLSIPSNIKKAYQDMSPIIGNAIFENPKIFGISLFYKEKNNLEVFYFNKDDNKELIKFNSFSTFCSAKGKFYISGGEKEEDENKQIIGKNNGNEGEENYLNNEEYDDFVCIDMNKLNYYNLYLNVLPKLSVKRTWHSMIFVPNQYIFIVGGLSTKTVEIYDIDKNEIYIDSELIEKRCEPTMCLVNNIYLYAFCGFSPFKNFSDSIERCNLLKKKREWEFIDYSHKIIPSFFGVSYFKDDEIILISSKDNNDDDNKSYTIKIEKDEDIPDEINEIKLNNKEFRTFKDKLFYPFFDNLTINCPLIVGEERQVLLLDLNTGNIERKIYK